ncbi:MAG: tetratricopeptide repeat protein, partial [Rickettsiales bacterium]
LIKDQYISKSFVGDTQSQVDYYINKACVYFGIFELYEEAITELNKAIELVKQNNDYKETLFYAYVQLAQVYIYSGDVTNAKSNISLASDLSNIDDPARIIASKEVFYFVNSKISLDQDDLESALKYSDKDIEILKSKKNEIVNDIQAYLIRNEILLRMNRDQEAFYSIRDLYDKIINIYKEPQTISMAQTLYAKAARKLKQYDLAKELAIKAKETLKEIYPEGKDYNVVNNHIILGEIYDDLGEYDNADKEYKMAEESFNSFCTKKEANYIRDIYYNLALLSVKTARVNQMKHYFGLLKNNFGMDNKKTNDLIKYLYDHNLPMPWTK